MPNDIEIYHIIYLSQQALANDSKKHGATAQEADRLSNDQPALTDIKGV